MVLFSGLWTNNNYNRYTEDDGSIPQRRNTSAQRSEDLEAFVPDDTQHDSNRRRSSYVSSVLFGGLWTRRSNNEMNEALRRRPRRKAYGSLNDDNNNNNNNNNNEQAGNLNEHNSTSTQDDDDDDSDFPSLTSVFNPDEMDGNVLRMCLTCVAVYLAVAVVAYSFVLEHWTIIDALYFAVSTFTTVGK